jgi:hypothetical protein
MVFAAAASLVVAPSCRDLPEPIDCDEVIEEPGACLGADYLACHGLPACAPAAIEATSCPESNPVAAVRDGCACAADVCGALLDCPDDATVVIGRVGFEGADADALAIEIRAKESCMVTAPAAQIRYRGGAGIMRVLDADNATLAELTLPSDPAFAELSAPITGTIQAEGIYRIIVTQPQDGGDQAAVIAAEVDCFRLLVPRTSGC